MPTLSKPSQQKSLFDDIDIFDDDSAEVIEEKQQKKTLKQVKLDRLKEQNDYRQQEWNGAVLKKKDDDDDAAKKERLQRGMAALNLGTKAN